MREDRGNQTFPFLYHGSPNLPVVFFLTDRHTDLPTTGVHLCLSGSFHFVFFFIMELNLSIHFLLDSFCSSCLSNKSRIILTPTVSRWPMAFLHLPTLRSGFMPRVAPWLAHYSMRSAADLLEGDLKRLALSPVRPSLHGCACLSSVRACSRQCSARSTAPSFVHSCAACSASPMR